MNCKRKIAYLKAYLHALGNLTESINYVPLFDCAKISKLESEVTVEDSLERLDINELEEWKSHFRISIKKAINRESANSLTLNWIAYYNRFIEVLLSDIDADLIVHFARISHESYGYDVPLYLFKYDNCIFLIALGASD
jgi:hypothetical protein